MSIFSRFCNENGDSNFINYLMVHNNKTDKIIKWITRDDIEDCVK